MTLQRLQIIANLQKHFKFESVKVAYYLFAAVVTGIVANICFDFNLLFDAEIKPKVLIKVGLPYLNKRNSGQT